MLNVTRQTIEVCPVLTLLRVHRANIVQYMGKQWADFYNLPGKEFYTEARGSLLLAQNNVTPMPCLLIKEKIKTQNYSILLISSARHKIIKVIALNYY